MSLITQVKVGNITNLSEARYCAGMGVDYLSFPAASINPTTFQEITSWVSGPKFGIEVETHNESQIDSYQPDFIVMPIGELPNTFKYNNLVVKVTPTQWQAQRDKLILKKNQILFLELHPDTLSELDKIIHEIDEDFHVFLKHEGTEFYAYIQFPIDGLSLEGHPEERPGLKEYPLAETLEKLESPD